MECSRGTYIRNDSNVTSGRVAAVSTQRPLSSRDVTAQQYRERDVRVIQESEQKKNTCEGKRFRAFVGNRENNQDASVISKELNR